MVTGRASARSRAWFLAAAAVLAAARPAASLRVAFVSDTGVGNANPAWGWTDYQGVRRGEYKVNGELCKDHKGEPCRGYSRARDVLAAAKDNGAELVVHAGDLDYESAPRMWRLFVDETVRGQGMDFVAAKGNHDADGWDGVSGLWSDPDDGYAAQLRPTQPGNCYGAYGESLVCDYGAVTLVISSVGVDAAGESANQREVAFLERALSQSASRFKVCVWHMNQENMQVSYKGDSTGWGAFEICRKHGAFIVNGHAHTYSRTKEMVRFGERRWSHTAEDLRVADAVLAGAQDENVVRLRSGENGSTAVAVVGFGGYRNEAQLKSAPHWAKVYSSKCLDGDGACETAPEQKKYGALMCDFPEDANRAECWVVTTTRPEASRREKRAAYRNPVDRFFLVAGEAADETRASETNFADYNDGRTLSVASDARREGGVRRRRRFDGDLDRSTCVDVQPPDHSCALQKQWGKCDWWFMKSNGLCDRTCGRCVDAPRAKREDYEDDYVEQPRAAEEKPADAPAPAVTDAIDFDSIAADVLRLRQDEGTPSA